jgi:hypothetical protein
MHTHKLRIIKRLIQWWLKQKIRNKYCFGFFI